MQIIAIRYPMLVAIKYDFGHSRAYFLRYFMTSASSPCSIFLSWLAMYLEFRDLMKSKRRHSETNMPGMTISPSPRMLYYGFSAE